MIKHLILGLFYLGAVFNSNAQNFEWSKVYGGVQSDILRKLCQAGSGNYSYAYISTTDIINFKQATIKLNSLTLSKNQAFSDCIVKFDTAGKVVWAKQIFEPVSVASTSIISDYNDNLYLLGNIDRISDSVRFESSKPFIKLLKGEFSKTFLIKLDSSGNYIWQKEFPNVMNRTNSLNFVDDNIYLSLQKNNKSKYFISGNDTITDHGVIIKLDTAGSLSYSKGMGSSKNYDTNGEVFKVKDSIILFLRVFYSNYKINNDSIPLKYSNTSLGHLIKVSLNETNNKSKINQITSDGGTEFTLNAISKINDRQFALSGAFKDSFPFINYKKIVYPNNNLSNTVLIVKDNGVKTHFNLRYYPTMSGGQFLICSSKGQFIYVGGTAIGDFEFNGTKTKRNEGLNVFCKLDTLCNPLWLFRTGDSTSSFYPSGFSFDNFKGVYFGTTFSNTINMGGSILNSSNYGNDFILAKVFDYSISRGPVSKGPYCAGDSIIIPYTKEGIYDTSNIFMAQLSDENGEFEGIYRELGRLKSNSDGTIKGILPMFDVESSASYRIRIISTKPDVQSYYKLDSLRLLIYSKDTANAGKDTTICSGQKVQLTTSGGSRWRWSPGNLVSDSMAKRPMALSDKTTTYRIIISDSSGCGKNDTAYKTITLRQSLKSTLAFHDTVLCDNAHLKIPVKFTGGDSVNYHWDWFVVSSPKVWKIISKGKLKLGDTLFHYPEFDSVITETLAIILNDDCTIKADTSFLTISLQKPVVIKKFKDTLICNGEIVTWKARTLGSLPPKFQWQWNDLTNKRTLSNLDSLSLNAIQTIQIQLTLKNGCASDTNLFTLKVNPPLEAMIKTEKELLGDTILCFGQSINLISVGKGGVGSGHLANWYLDNYRISNKDTLSLKTSDYFPAGGNSRLLILILRDDCPLGTATVSKNITVIPSPKADFTFGVACEQRNTEFVFTGNKPSSPITTIIHWDFNGEGSSGIDHPAQLFNISGKKKVTLSVSSDNGCKDYIVKDVLVKPQPKTDFTVNDVCENDTVIFINKSTVYSGLLNYKWGFGDGVKSVLESPKHLYFIGGVSRTFNVTMVAMVKDGCSDSITKAVTVNANPISDFSYSKTGTKVVLTATQPNNTKYLWKFGSTDSVTTTITTCTHIITKPEQNKVCLKITNLAGCVNETCKDVSLDIFDINKQKGFKLYPNPNSGSFIIEIDNPKEKIIVEIYDFLGQMIQQKELTESLNSLDLNLTNGYYLVRVINGIENFNQNLIVGK